MESQNDRSQETTDVRRVAFRFVAEPRGPGGTDERAFAGLRGGGA